MCSCNGVASLSSSGYGYGYGNPGSVLANVGTAMASVAAYSPAVQVQAFEPAFYTPCPTWSVIPYSPALVSVAMPTYGVTAPGAAVTASLAAADVVAADVNAGVPFNATVAPVFTANECGPCGRAYSPLPPNGFFAWQKLLQDTNRPYDALVSGGYGIRRTY